AGMSLGEGCPILSFSHSFTPWAASPESADRPKDESDSEDINEVSGLFTGCGGGEKEYEELNCKDYAVSFYLREAWRDARLSFEPFQYGNTEKKVTKIKLGVGRWDEIWTPDIFFRNEKNAYFHRVTVSNRMLTLDHLGNLWYVTK
ncbi:hypothetical protein LSH36_95g00041, partial [Paralvinella palmiformis]